MKYYPEFIKILLIFIFLLNFSTTKAQLNFPKWKAYDLIPIINYAYSGRNIFSAGVQCPIGDVDDNSLFLSAGYGAYLDNRMIKGLPYWNLEYIRYNNLTTFKIEGSHQHINPSIGVSLIAYGELSLGFSVPFKSEYPFRGFSVGLLLRPSFIFK